jgi:hypothetical protein
LFKISIFYQILKNDIVVSGENNKCHKTMLSRVLRRNNIQGQAQVKRIIIHHAIKERVITRSLCRLVHTALIKLLWPYKESKYFLPKKREWNFLKFKLDLKLLKTTLTKF